MTIRKQIRDAWHAEFSKMVITNHINTATKGRIHRFHPQDLPAINITTFQDRVLVDEQVHGGDTRHVFEQTINIEIHCDAKDHFEDNMDAVEDQFWIVSEPFKMDGVVFMPQGSIMTPSEDVEHPQGARILSFTATYSADTRQPNTIIA